MRERKEWLRKDKNFKFKLCIQTMAKKWWRDINCLNIPKLYACSQQISIFSKIGLLWIIQEWHFKITLEVRKTWSPVHFTGVLYLGISSFKAKGNHFHNVDSSYLIERGVLLIHNPQCLSYETLKVYVHLIRCKLYITYY